eukprot:sb/3478521/
MQLPVHQLLSMYNFYSVESTPSLCSLCVELENMCVYQSKKQGQLSQLSFSLMAKVFKFKRHSIKEFVEPPVDSLYKPQHLFKNNIESDPDLPGCSSGKAF